MGRPLHKDSFGTSAVGSFGEGDSSASQTGIRVSFFDTALRTDGVIVKQRGAKTFVVSQVTHVTENLTQTPFTSTCVLQSATPSAAGQMRMVGYTAQSGGDVIATEVAIARITKRVVTDFSGNKYTWKLENDSSNDYIVLTPIA